MSPRRIAVLATIAIALGGAVVGAVAIADSSSLFSQPVAQTPARPLPPDKSSQDKLSWLKELNLTSDQVQKIEAIRSQHKDQLAKERQTMRQTQRELRELMAGNAPADQVRQKYRQMRTIRQRFADTQFESILAMREVLNPQQRRQFADRMQKQREGGRDRGRMKEHFEK